MLSHEHRDVDSATMLEGSGQEFAYVASRPGIERFAREIECSDYEIG